ALLLREFRPGVRRRAGGYWPRAALTSCGCGVIVLESTKVLSAWETLIGAGLGSPLGVIVKLPTMPSWTRVLNSEAIVPRGVASPAWIAGSSTSAAWPA